MNVCVIGGGIMGITAAYFLTRQGWRVDLYESAPTLGGLAGPLTLPDGAVVDRFYHAILSSDSSLRTLCQELGIEDQMRFRQTQMGFYYDSRLFSMNDLRDFLRFPPLSWVDRVRLGITILRAQMIRDWEQLEQVSVEEWLVKWSGRNAYKSLWRPMLNAKFDGRFDQVPATWVWSRLVRTKSTRGGAAQKEEAGYLVGGYITLLKAMAAAIEAAGGRIRLSWPIQEIVLKEGAVAGVRDKEGVKPYDAVLSTMQTPLLSRLLPNAPAPFKQKLEQQRYLGVLCPLLVLDRPLTPYWTLYLTDESVPFTGIVETTNYIAPQDVGGHHLLYLPKYSDSESVWFAKSDDEIRTIWLDELKRMFPQFDESWVRYLVVNRARYVEPLHGLGAYASIPQAETPVRGLYLATTAQIYPALTNGESVTRHARHVTGLMKPATEAAALHSSAQPSLTFAR